MHVLALSAGATCTCKLFARFGRTSCPWPCASTLPQLKGLLSVHHMLCRVTVSTPTFISFACCTCCDSQQTHASCVLSSHCLAVHSRAVSSHRLTPGDIIVVLRGQATCDMVTLLYIDVATSLAAVCSHGLLNALYDKLPGALSQVLLQGTCLVEESILSGEVRAYCDC